MTLRITWLLLFTVALIGCQSSDQPPLSKVSGVVTLDGKPLDGVAIQFSPVGGGRPSIGMTDANGSYELTYVRDEMGALHGEHLVKLSKIVAKPGATKEQLETGEYPTMEIIPEKYFEDEAIKVTVEGSSSSIDLELTSG
ncbi:hypothetical protein [Calycomorphotria hydatis]|uniref:Carboxypeptidase regulatory-like domain-containing protein n=1 Tax=Calycomorphotria hydatis TaxID=2528027 RepID=A0A517T3V3_9PLAN|nr:hypothetical protein [Calycomorphotria hydatis]QDT63052.1 hypothetical protein V22_02510 [Calycomorphotria hydatis]